MAKLSEQEELFKKLYGKDATPESVLRMNSGYSQKALTDLSNGTYAESRKQIAPVNNAKVPSLSPSNGTGTQTTQRRFGSSGPAYNQGVLGSELPNATFNPNITDYIDVNDKLAIQNIAQNSYDGRYNEFTKDKWDKGSIDALERIAQKYGKSADEMMSDYYGVIRKNEVEQAKAHPILNDIGSVFASPFVGVEALLSAGANSIDSSSRLAQKLENDRQIDNGYITNVRDAVKENTGDKGDKVIDTVNQLADRTVASMIGKAAGGVAGNVISGILAGGVDTNRMIDEYMARGASREEASRAALVHGTIEGIGTGIATGIFDKTKASTVIGELAKSAGSGAFENGVSQIIEDVSENLTLNDKSIYYSAKNNALANGLSESSAVGEGLKELAKSTGSALLMGALFGAGMKGLDIAGKKSLGKLIGSLEDSPSADGTKPYNVLADATDKDYDEILKSITDNALGENKLPSSDNGGYFGDGSKPINFNDTLPRIRQTELDANWKPDESMTFKRAGRNIGDGADRYAYETGDGRFLMYQDSKGYVLSDSEGEIGTFKNKKEAENFVNALYQKESIDAKYDAEIQARRSEYAPIENPTEEDYNNILNNMLRNRGGLNSNTEIEPTRIPNLFDNNGTMPSLEDADPYGVRQLPRIDNYNFSTEDAPTKVSDVPTVEPQNVAPTVDTNAPLDANKAGWRAIQLDETTPKNDHRYEALGVLLTGEELSKSDIRDLAKVSDEQLATLGMTRSQLNDFVARYDDANGTNISAKMPGTQMELDFETGEAKMPTDSEQVAPVNDTPTTDTQMELDFDNGTAKMPNETVGMENSTKVPTEAEIPQKPTSTPVDSERTTPIVEPSNGEDIGSSKLVDNTLVNSKIIDEAELQDSEVRAIAEYSIQHEEATMKKALQNVTEDALGHEKAYASGRRDIVDGTDVDTTMLLMSRLTDAEKAARDAGDTAKAKELHDRKISLGYRLKQATNKGGQLIQALAKWNRTADGAELNARAMKSDIANDWASSNGQQADINKNVAKNIKTGLEKKLGNAQFNRVINSATKEPANNFAIMKSVKTQIEESLEKYSMKGMFNDDEIDFLASMVQRGVSDGELADALNNKFATGSMGISDDAIVKVNDLFEEAKKYGYESKKRAEVEAEAYKILAMEVYGNKRSAKEAFEAWRYLAMLGNPRTHMRNVIGNTTHFVVTEISDNVAAALESGVDAISKKLRNGKGIERTKAFLTAKDSDLVKRSRVDADEGVYMRLNDKGRYTDVKGGILGNRDAFGTSTGFGKFINKLNDLNSGALDMEDYFGLKNKYSMALARFLKANGADESIFDSYNTKDIELLEKARAYAIDQAQQATFHEASKMADAINEFSKKMQRGEAETRIGRVGQKAFGYLIEGTVPFKKTPINIVKQGIKYSPVSLVEGLGDIVANVVKYGTKKGNIKSASDIIGEVSSGAVGSLITALGWYLAKNKILNGSMADNYDKKQQLEREGIQEYSVMLGDGKSYTLDWLSPISMPLFVGAEIAKWQDEHDDNTDVDKIINLVSTIADPVVEMSMMQGIQNTLDAVKSKDLGSIGSATIGAATSYVSQAVPTLFGQVARSVDGLRRNTYSGKSGVVGYLDKTAKKLANKTIGLSSINEPYVDAEGNTEENVGGNVLGRLAYNLLSPGYYKEGRVGDPTDAELDRVYDVTGENVYPTVTNGKVKVNDGENTTEIKMSPQAQAEYQKRMGNIVRRTQEQMVGYSDFDSLTDTDKADVLRNVKTLAAKFANSEVNGHVMDKNEQKAYDIFKSSGVKGLAEYIVDKKIASNLDSNYDDYKEKGAEKIQADKQTSADAKALGLTTSQYEDAQKYSGGAQQYSNDLRRANSYGFKDVDNYNNAKEIFGGDVPQLKEYSNYYNQYSGKGKKERYSELTRYGWTDEQKAKVMFKNSSEGLNESETEIYDNFGWSGLWKYEGLVKSADTDRSGTVSQAEWKKYKKSNEIDEIGKVFEEWLFNHNKK